MLIFDKIESLQLFLKKSKGKTIGFVPTMGALHEGHLSLIQASKEKTDITICSVFVNPAQFNKVEDLEKYPRNIEKDVGMLEQKGCDLLFFPTVDEMYPVPPTKQYDFGDLGVVMEGKHRPGHFNGVGLVIERFFEIIHPDYAFFGEKDFQQLAVIRELVRQLNSSTVIVGCPIYREKSGLAMSSRNERLSEKEKEDAQAIFKALEHVKKKSTNSTIAELKQYFFNTLNQYQNFEVEYFSVADGNTLQPITNWGESDYCVAFTAVNVGSVRLIDNMTIFS